MKTTIHIEEIRKATVNTKNGPAQKIGIKGANGTWYGCFYRKECDAWKEGDIVELEIEQSGKYHNIILGNKKTIAGVDFTEVHEKLDKILKLLDPDGKVSRELEQEEVF